MPTVRCFGLVATLLLVFAAPSAGQGWGRLTGQVVELGSREPVVGVTVLVDGTNFGTATNVQGNYGLRIPSGRYAIRFSAVGYSSRTDSVVIIRDRTSVLDVSLEESTVQMDEITVQEDRPQNGTGTYVIEPEDVENLPGPFKDPLRSLKVMPGVVSNNELSNQYSVRGGGFNENLLFVNGFEVFLPFRPRQGEQEGLSLLNPSMSESITFYAGDFPPRYGGKLSSALDVQYARSHSAPLTGSAYVSLLDAGLATRSALLEGRLGVNLGVRKARASRFFETQDLQGAYEPDYTDFQALVSYELAPDHHAEVLGILADHEFTLDPNSRKTFFGTLSQDSRLAASNIKSLWTTYDPDNFESDGYRTGLLGVKLRDGIAANLWAEHDLSYFRTEETERFELSGNAVLFQVDPGSDNPQGGEGQIPIGNSRQEDYADNAISVSTFTARGRWVYTVGTHGVEGGWMARRYDFDDRLNEKSVVIGPSTDGDIVRVVADSLRDSTSLSTHLIGFYIQDTFDIPSDGPGFRIVAGTRVDYFAFSGEWTVSPRISATYALAPTTTLTGSLGVYRQTPTYREFRGKPEPGESIIGALNREIRSQTAVQIVAGFQHFIPSKRLMLRAETFYRHLSNVISYDIENVRVLYSGENDATGYVFGADFQLRGEFVPGLESWVNYSLLVAREQFLEPFRNELNEGVVARPTDQRHTFSLFIQDYIPTDPTWKLHLRTLFGSGLPYTPPIPGERVGNIQTQVPGERFSARYPRYFRFDIGLTKRLRLFDRGLSRPIELELTGELLNVFNMINTVAYSWVPDAGGIWNRIPTRLTPRTFNIRVRLEF
jgi:hypothetical protein